MKLKYFLFFATFQILQNLFHQNLIFFVFILFLPNSGIVQGCVQQQVPFSGPVSPGRHRWGQLHRHHQHRHGLRQVGEGQNQSPREGESH